VVVVVAAGSLGRYVLAKRSSRRAEAWEGVVADKTRSSPDGQNMYHYVQLTLNGGQTRRVRIRGKLWKGLSVGDKLRKRSGEYHPTQL
jgi:hypothetical protein